MRKLCILFTLMILLGLRVSAAEFTAPQAPEAAMELMPQETESFSDGVRILLKKAVMQLQPDLARAGTVCAEVIAVVILVSVLRSFPGSPAKTVEMAGAVIAAIVLLSETHTLIGLASDTVRELGDYGKLLLPVMTAAMAAQGMVSSSAALHLGTAVFDAVLGTAITSLLIPGVYVYLALSAANSALGEEMLAKLRDFVKWLSTWCLKIILYVFTGYMGITGVVSGSADAAALKAAKLTISGMVPVVGGILSDASEAVLVGAGMVKNAAGIYGMLVVLALCLGPFLRIGCQYLLLKATAALCAVFDAKKVSSLVQDFSGAMGLLLAMTGALCLLLLISTVCFLKGVG